MSDLPPAEGQALARPQNAQRISRDDIPTLGTWHHVDYYHTTYPKGKEKKTKHTMLMCVAHIASNHVVFTRSTENGRSIEQVRHEDLLADTKPEPNWQALILAEIEEHRKALAKEVRLLADKMRSADLISDQAVEAPPTLLPSVLRVDPDEQKKRLTRLKEKDHPEAHRRIQTITAELVALQRDLFLPMFVETERMNVAIKTVDKKLFALELYAGIYDQIIQIKEGAPAPPETPITVRQMLRYMDEECLIDYDGGGMDFRKIADFDDWVAKPENYTRLCPEPRCVVALKVRRHSKDYGRPESLGHAIQMLEDHKCNEWTYLLLRNGEQVYRLATEIDFDPRLLPLREEFHKPFTKRKYDSKARDYVDAPITPRDLDYDEKRDERLDKIYEYNRVMFLLQGILDRSKVFSPHPPINLADETHIEQFFRANFDEELGLPSSSPPNWEVYRARLNASLKIGSHVYGGHTLKGEESKPKYRRDHKYTGNNRGYNVNDRPMVAEVTSIRRDRITKKITGVRVSWPWGMRWGYEHSDGYGGYHGKYGQWPVNKKCHEWLDVNTVVHVEAYVPGDFKQFLCDAYLKGEYLKWAPPLLRAEAWHKGQRDALTKPLSKTEKGEDEDE